MNEKTEIQQRIENAVTNGVGYHDSSYANVGRFQDPIQAHLGRMEEKNPSSNKIGQRFLQWVSGITALLDRALQYHSTKLSIWKHSEYQPLDNKKDFSIIKNNLEEKIINLIDFSKEKNFHKYSTTGKDYLNLIEPCKIIY